MRHVHLFWLSTVTLCSSRSHAAAASPEIPPPTMTIFKGREDVVNILSEHKGASKRVPLAYGLLDGVKRTSKSCVAKQHLYRQLEECLVFWGSMFKSHWPTIIDLHDQLTPVSSINNCSPTLTNISTNPSIPVHLLYLSKLIQQTP